MKASDALKKTNPRDASESKLDRDSSLNPSKYDFGMGDDEDYSDFFDTTNEAVDNESNSVGNYDFNSTGGYTDFNQFNTFNQPQINNGYNQVNSNIDTKEREREEYWNNFWDLVLRGIVQFFKELGLSIKGLKARFWTKFGAKMIQFGSVYTLVGVVMLVLKVKDSIAFIIGGLLTLINGVYCLMFFYDKAKEEESSENSIDLGMGSIKFDNSQEVDIDNIESDFIDDVNEDDEFIDEEYYDEDEDLYEEYSEVFENKSEELEQKGFDEALKEIDVPDKKMYTRQFLFDNIFPVLQSITVDYDTFKEINVDSEVFDSLNHIVVTSAKMLTNNKDDIPYLIRASENLHFIKLDINRTKGFKNKQIVQALCDEIANIFKVDDDKGLIPEENEGIYANGITVGDKIIVKLYKGEENMFSLKDILSKNKEFVLDTDNKIPCILGIDGDGQVVMRDFKNIESILITGFQRSGKTWFVLSILSQMCMWNSPNDINIIIFDPKNKLSDFKNFNLPHVKEFLYKNEDMVEKLRWLVREESTRRENLIGDINSVNIWDFKRENPDIDLPIIYVVIDEVISLADSMDRDTKAEFQGYLRELVTRLPAAGIRAMLVPHIIKNDIINKTTTSTIQCRVSVKGDSQHIENNLGIKNFPHMLKRTGDMAVKLPDAECKFVRAAVLTDSNNKNQELFNYLRKLWVKIDPDCERGSRAEIENQNEQMKELLEEKLGEIDDFFDEM